MHPRVTSSTRVRAAFLLFAVLLAAGPLLSARPARAAATFVVTTAGDNPDADLADDRCDTTPGPGAPCSLRAAIQEANATPGPDAIHFNIPGPGVKTITPAAPLPAIEHKITIDGYTQPGSKPNTAATGTNAVLAIELDGSNAGDSNIDGLRIDGANSLIRGVVINRFSSAGIEVLEAATGTLIQGCFLGTDAAGANVPGNKFGVEVEAAGVQVGGPGPAARNLVSGNVQLGVYIGSPSTGTRVLGNLIGTDRTGGARLGDRTGGDAENHISGGVETWGSAAIIGGATAGEANTVAFNGYSGVLVYAGTGNRVLRNSIFANDGLGIDLVVQRGTDRTPNDPQDADDGPNTLQNVPVITAVTSTSVSGTLNSTPNQDFVLHLFSNPGFQGQGRFFAAGPLVVTTDADGDASFTFANIDPPLPAGRTVTATATNHGGSTSEFSRAVAVSDGGG